MTPVQAQWLTLMFVGAVTYLVIGFDAWMVLRHGPDASISRVLGRVFGRWPALGLAVVFWLGVLVGHCWLRAE